MPRGEDLGKWTDGLKWLSKLDSAKQSRADMKYHEVCGSVPWPFEQMCPAMQVFQRKYATLCLIENRR